MQRCFRVVRVIWPLLELSFEQRDLMSIPELVDRRSGVLMPCQDGMEFVDDTLCEVTAPGDAVDRKLNGGLLIPQDVNQAGWLHIRIRARHPAFQDSVRYQRFRGTSIQVVQPFQDASLDAQPTDQALVELSQAGLT